MAVREGLGVVDIAAIVVMVVVLAAAVRSQSKIWY